MERFYYVRYIRFIYWFLYRENCSKITLPTSMSCLNYDSSEFQCIVHLLDGRQLPAGIRAADKPATLLARIAQVLSLTQLDFFGLRFVCPLATSAQPESQPSLISDSEFSLWLNPKKTFLQQLKHWVHSPQQVHLHFGVRFYPGILSLCASTLHNAAARLSYYISIINIF